MRLRTRFAVALVVVAVVLSVTTLVGFTLYRDAIVTQERTDLSRTSDSVAGQLEVILGEKREAVRLWGQNRELRGHGTARQDAALAAFVRTTAFSGASVVRANGTMVAIEARGSTSAASGHSSVVPSPTGRTSSGRWTARPTSATRSTPRAVTSS